MRWWDESMFAVNTYEMLHNGKFFTPYFDSIPDLYNNKPPLTCWLQILFVKTVGYNELAIRLPSASAAALTILLLFRFLATHFNLIWAWLSALILLTSHGFIDFHTARTGESDSLLTLFLFLTAIQFFKFIITGKNKCIFLFFVFLSLAFATKMLAALLFSPAYFIILMRYKKIRSFVFNKAFLGGIVLFIFIGISLIGLRELQAPGYINKLLFVDAGRIFTVIENHEEPLQFYIKNLFDSRFSVWFTLLCTGIVIAFITEKNAQQQLLQFFSMSCFVYLFIISSSITKLIWYDMPLYPFFAVISAYPLYLLINQLISFTKIKSFHPSIWMIVFIFIYPYLSSFERSQANAISKGEKALEANERYIFQRGTDNVNLDGIKVYYSGYNRALFFYKYKLSEIGQTIELTNDPLFNPNDKVLVCNDSLKKLLADRYVLTSIDNFENASLFKVIDKNN